MVARYIVNTVFRPGQLRRAKAKAAIALVTRVRKVTQAATKREFR